MKRDSFLDNIRTQLQSAYLPDAERQKPAAIAPVDESNHTLDTLLEQFRQEVLTLSGELYQANSEADVYEHILSIFAQKEARSFIAWDDKYLPINHLNDRLIADGYTKHELDIPNEPERRRHTHLALSDVKIGLTGAMGALSDTGSLIVQCGIGRSRLASLLPPVHIAILKKESLLPSMAHFIQTYPNAAKETSNLVFITGPSRTADIEQTLTLGVHGPKELYIILV